MKIRKLAVVAILGVGMLLGSVGCNRSLTSGISIGVTDGLSDGLAQLISEFIRSFSGTVG